MLPAWAAAYVGTPFEAHGRTHDGVDCWGLARLIWREQAGIEVPSYAAEYAATEDGPVIAAAIRREGVDGPAWREIAAGSERRFDAVHLTGIVTVDGVARRHAMHVGVVLARPWIIHVEAGVDATLADYVNNRLIRRRVLGFYRHADLFD